MSELKKTISPWAMIALGAAGVIGSSWLYLGSDFFAAFGAGGTILGMALGTLLAFCVAKAYSELASRFPRAGGEIVYAYVGGGRLLSFMVGWMLIGAYGGMVAFYVTAAGRLLTTMWPGLEVMPLYTIGGETIFGPVLAIGIALTLIILATNWFGVSIGAVTQLVLFIVMIVLAVIVAAVGFGAGSIDNFLPAFDASVQQISPAPVAIVAFLLPAFAFLAGFGVVAVLAEEANAPAKLLGKIVGWSVLLAGGFYILVLTATAFVIPWTETAGLKNGTIEAFDKAGFPMIAMAAFIIGVLGIITTFIAVFAASSRLMLALARVQLLPPFFGKVHEKSGVPRNALLFTTAIGIGLGWLGPGALLWFLNVGGVYIGVVWAITVYCFYRVRVMYKGSEPPYKVRFAWVPALGAIAGIVVILGGLIPGLPLSLRWPYEYAIIVVWLLLGGLLYLLSPRTGTREEHLRSLLGDTTAN
ncbi:MAG: APC family permease [Actinomycetales bacterium]|nr:APC family permease [Actinomycetales bacterium]